MSSTSEGGGSDNLARALARALEARKQQRDGVETDLASARAQLREALAENAKGSTINQFPTSPYPILEGVLRESPLARMKGVVSPTLEKNILLLRKMFFTTLYEHLLHHTKDTKDNFERASTQYAKAQTELEAELQYVWKVPKTDIKVLMDAYRETDAFHRAHIESEHAKEDAVRQSDLDDELEIPSILRRKKVATNGNGEHTDDQASVGDLGEGGEFDPSRAEGGVVADTLSEKQRAAILRALQKEDTLSKPKRDLIGKLANSRFISFFKGALAAFALTALASDSMQGPRVSYPTYQNDRQAPPVDHGTPSPTETSSPELVSIVSEATADGPNVMFYNFFRKLRNENPDAYRAFAGDARLIDVTERFSQMTGFWRVGNGIDEAKILHTGDTLSLSPEGEIVFTTAGGHTVTLTDNHEPLMQEWPDF